MSTFSALSDVRHPPASRSTFIAMSGGFHMGVSCGRRYLDATIPPTERCREPQRNSGHKTVPAARGPTHNQTGQDHADTGGRYCHSGGGMQSRPSRTRPRAPLTGPLPERFSLFFVYSSTRPLPLCLAGAGFSCLHTRSHQGILPD